MSTTVTAAGELLHLSPHDVEIEANVRLDPRLHADFLASIAEHGVLVPVLAVKAEGGTKPLVREGQRRIQAARQVGLDAIPVYLRTIAGDDAEVRAERVIQQIVTNDHRLELTCAERARGIAQLLLDGVTPAKVAKRLSTTRETVAAARTVVGYDSAMTAMDSGQISLTEAAQFIEFDDDADAQAELLKVAGSPQFDHRVAQLRTERADRGRYDAAVSEYRAKGYEVLADYPEWADVRYIPLRVLQDGQGAPLTGDHVPGMAPAAWAVVLESVDAWADAETGELIDEGVIDFETACPDVPPAEGTRHVNTVVEAVIFEPEFYCTDPDAAAVTLLPWAQQRYGGGPAAVAADDAVEGEIEHERRAAARTERRKLIALNRLGSAAEEVRRTWVRENLLTRKAAPKGAAYFIAQAITADSLLLSDYRGTAVTRELLGLAAGDRPASLVESLPESTADARAIVVMLGMLLGAIEAHTPKDAWRRPSELSKAYLNFLTANGYTLSAIEQVILDTRTADSLYTEQG